jgi:hypothetical protein
MLALPDPHHMPCTECGASVAQSERDRHVCEPERRLDFRVLQHRDEINLFDNQLAAYLETPRGRFEAWYASERR